MKRALLVLLPLVSVPLSVPADDVVYETLSGVSIGRVFLTAAERDHLDRVRRNPPAESPTTSTSPVDESAPESKQQPPAGFIISSRGETRVWRDGDFVDASSGRPESMRFPGEVRVTRHTATDSDGDED